MKHWGLWASSLSADTHVKEEQKPSSNYLTPQCFIRDAVGICIILIVLGCLLKSSP